jgi:hypothetical protein
MKKRNRNALLLLAATAVSAIASVQAATYNGDLLIGFTSQSGNDLIYDIGNASTLTSVQQWDHSSALSGYNLSTVQWGVVGSQRISTIGNLWATTSGATVALTLPGNPQWAGPNTSVASMGSQFVTLGLGNSVTPPSGGTGSDNSWNVQTITGSLTTDYINNYVSPNNTGLATANFYHVVADNSAATLMGTISLAANGTVTFTPVPEPTTLTLFTGLGVLAFSFRRQFSRKV